MSRAHASLPDRLTIASLHARGYSDAQIAKALGLTPVQCREALTEARAVLEAHAVTLATDYLTASDIAARKGDHRPARDMLDRLKVTEPTGASDPGTHVGIHVQVNGFTLPGLPVQVTAAAGHIGLRSTPAFDVVTEPAPTASRALRPTRPDSPEQDAAQNDEAHTPDTHTQSTLRPTPAGDGSRA